MARQECNNTFSDGLMMDLNPINTPKSVLTDCLNGTYITYNGNEFVLQNDMGNYKLKNCKLPTNFIPVGVKGYGDILYIVSYNPITNETEIGSYPAPQSIFTTGETEDALEATPKQLAPFTWGPGTDIKATEIEYPTIIRTNKKPIFIFAGTDEETYKLNPGDEFRFSGNVDIPAFKYQHLNFYIIDEDNKLYDIDDTQIYKEDGTLVSPDLRKVFWETPGWLTAQYDLYVPDKFNLNLRSLNVPEFLVAKDNGTSSQVEDKSLDELEPDKNYFKVSMDLSSQTIITDRLFQNELNKNFGKELANTYDHLYIRYLIKRNQNPPKEGEDDYGTFKGIVVSLDDGTTKDYTSGVTEEEYVYYDIPVWKHNYQDDIITAYNNIRPIWFCNNPKTLPNSKDLDIANYHGVVELTAYPIIKYNGLTLKYTQFSTTQRFPLNTLKNSSDITIADSIYKWSVDDDSCTISFNINGPFINANDITGRYEVYRINLFNYAKSEEAAKSQATEGTNENPKSISSYNVEEGLTGDFLVKENNKWIRKLDQSVSTSSFTSEEKLLMCEGDLSNLVLYGQNTLNIDWNSSKKYILNSYCNYYTNPDYDFTEGADNGDLEKVLKDTSFIGYNEDITKSQKTIDFSKEGGIYIFRVILEQNGSQLAESQQVLIPSEVFNEWFGSIDNYLDETNGITSSMWVGKWLDYCTVSNIIINQITSTWLSSVTPDQFILYKTSIDQDYKYLESTLDFTKADWFESWLKTKFLEINNYDTVNVWRNNKRTNTYIQLKINYSKLLDSVTVNGSVLDSQLKGNLWNSINKKYGTLKGANEYTMQYTFGDTWNINLSEISSEISITQSNTSKDIYISDPSATEYPFRIKYLPSINLWNTTEGGGNDHNRKSITARVRYNSNQGDTTNNFQSYSREYGSGFNATGGRETFSENEDFFQDAANTLQTIFKHPFAIGTALAEGSGDNQNHYRKVIAYGPNQREGGTVLSDFGNWEYGLIFRAQKKTSSKNASVFVSFGPNDNDGKLPGLRTFIKALWHVKIVKNSDNPQSIYFNELTTNSTFPETNTYTFNKSDYFINMSLLRCDDLIIYPNPNELLNIDNIISGVILNGKTSNIKASKEIYNFSIPSITLTLNYSTAEYRNFILNYNIDISNYNDDVQKDLNTAQSSVGGLHIEIDGVQDKDYYSDMPLNFNQLGADWDDVLVSSDILQNLSNLFGTREGEDLTKINICYCNSTTSEYLVAQTRSRWDEGSTQRTPSVPYCYFENRAIS